MRDTPKGEKFNFSGQTLIEDTETSHAFMEQGETSTYISRGLVHGSVKNPEVRDKKINERRAKRNERNKEIKE
jgi:hypothetical protein